MILFVLGAFLGVFDILPHEGFEGWEKAILAEIILEVSAAVIYLFFGEYIKRAFHRLTWRKPPVKTIYVKDVTEDKDRSQSEYDGILEDKYNKCDECYHNVIEALPPVICYSCNGRTKFKAKSEGSNPYAEGTLRWYAWEEENNATENH